MVVDITSYRTTNKSYEIEEEESSSSAVASIESAGIVDSDDDDNDDDLSYGDGDDVFEEVNKNNNNRLHNNMSKTGGSAITSSLSSHQQIKLTATTTTEAADSTNATNNNNNKILVDQILASEMNKLTVEERTQALEDVHGVSPTKEVSQITIQYKLNELDLYLNNHKTKVYKLAESMSSNYVQDHDFRLQFLQADDFDVSAAAKRICKFLQYKLDLFGRDLLTKDIKLVHLNDVDMSLLNESCVQILLQKDTAGRPILCTFPQLAPKSDYHNMLRVAFYIMMSIIDTYPDVRTRGFVSVFYNTTSKKVATLPVNLVWKSLKLRHAMPIKTSATHFCTRNSREPILRRVFKTIWWKLSRSHMRSRARRHHGNDVEIQNQLRGFGLPMDFFPFDDDGVMNFQYHHEWIRRRRTMETESKSSVTQQQSGEGMTMRTDGDLSLSCPIVAADEGDPAVIVGKEQSEEDRSAANMLLDVDMIQAELSMTSTIKKDDMQFMMSGVVTTNHHHRHHQQQQKPDNGGDDDNQMQSKDDSVDKLLKELIFVVDEEDPKSNINSALPFVPTVSTGSTTTTQSSDFALMDKQLPISSSPQIQQGKQTALNLTSSKNDLIFARSPSLPPPKLNNDSSSTSAVGSYVTPKPDDILFGRGKPMRNHPGNVKFRNILERHSDEYNMAPKFEKCIIAKRLVRTLSESGLRFLKPTSEGTTGWVIVDNKTAQDKVSQYFRSRRGAPKHTTEK